MNKKAKLLVAQRLGIGKTDRFVVEIKVWTIPESEKFPDGVKASFSLMDTQSDSIRLLVDNHEPYGYHVHGKLPQEPSHREMLSVKTYQEAEDFFWKEAERIIENEEK